MRPTSAPPAPEQVFPYGWRFVQRDGELHQVALTLEDVLHPQLGDVIPENTDHDADCNYLAAVFRSRPLKPPLALVTHDLLVDWGVAGIRNHSPDIGVFVGLNRDPRPTGLLDYKGLGAKCELLVEVVSPSTRKNDVVDKFDHYYRVGVPFYLIIDQEKEDGPRTLRAYRRGAHRYAEVESDDLYRIDLPQLRLTLGMKDNRAVCYEYGTLDELGDYTQTSRALKESEQAREVLEHEMEKQVDALHDANKEADRQREQAQSALQEADRQRRQAEKAAKEAEDQRQEADRQRQEREEDGRLHLQALEEKDKLIRELQEALRLQAGGANPTA